MNGRTPPNAIVVDTSEQRSQYEHVHSDGTWMYFTPLFGPILRRVETKYLQDPRLTNKEIAAHVEDVVRIPPVTGITADATGNLYFSP